MEGSVIFIFRSISGDFTEDSKHIKNGIKTAEVLNRFFSNILKNLKDPLCSNVDPIIQNVEDSALKIIAKYKDHASTLNIQTKYKGKKKFPFTKDMPCTQDIEKNIFDLKTKKACKISDVPPEVIKENVDFL